MSILGSLRFGSFRGVDFITDSAQTTGGRKTVSHEFTNSNKRTVEDLGQQLKTYSVTGTIAQPDYYKKRTRLIAALERFGTGLLIHPWYGEVSVVAKIYTITESQNALSVATFKMVFEATDDSTATQAISPNLKDILDKRRALNKLLQADTDTRFTTKPSFPLSYAQATATLGSVADSMDSFKRAVANAAQPLATVVGEIEDFSNDVNDIVNGVLSAGNGVQDLFSTGVGALQNARDRLETLASFFGFNKDSPFIDNAIEEGDSITPPDFEVSQNNITAATAQAKENTEAITQQVRFTALAFSYEALAQVEFTNLDDLDSSHNAIEQTFQTFSNEQGASAPIREALSLLRDTTEVFLNARRITTSQVVTLDIKPMPAQVLTYLLYGDLARSQDIIDLNANPNVSRYQGSVKALAL